MKLECLKDKLNEIIYKAEKMTGKNPTLPVLSSILIEAKNNSLLVKATNLDLGIEMEIPAKVYKTGKCAVPASVFSSFISSFQDEKNISLELENNVLVVSIGKATAKINTVPYDDFPIIPKLSKESATPLDPQSFVKGLRSVWYSASPSSIKPEISSVYIYRDGNDSIVFVATDSFRLAEKRIKIKKIKDFESVLIPFKNVPEIIRVLESNTKDVFISSENGQIAFFLESAYLVSRIIDGTFPDYQQIIPKESKTEVIVLKQDILNTLKTAHVFSDSFNQINLNISSGKKRFEIKTKNSAVGESENNLDAVFRGEDLVINFNYKYIFDCFQSIDSDSVSLSFNGLSKPLVIQGVSDKTFLYLVMPMNK
ncbi:MAG: DNA polymerase III subunit beta [Candidatus Zambryskibacteria bacterium RIFCSPHIGHO2_01_FULL_43_25]|uniref:Beta sliding clamp n=1 Tax=Candidatus Zambryskibacteria bacterium RIFCSPLOWO2_01_FULL_45_21 TaxID=1802761 RepID=A0A1G2U4C1_9BACT|nr:MAG: DNA polymerase III subunit beta [Candidatus Zambryskibacteria bacterium RIFCSPHIGHO2_01_FULL_43_25]OHB00750.1 MAG: DNA polymerase III subunit beta [Candidatus Zambryskibacteria bacterium RIFCSPHIGHO2_12_FULL_44_12b]OHB04346.1 MAG: DNA polymerase III subunit beta [Candidatus Zambryskibacteria bacterium RIFCSPLOWO2_01_FULL_45_21]